MRLFGFYHEILYEKINLTRALMNHFLIPEEMALKYFTSLGLVLNSNFRIFFDHLLESFPGVVMNHNFR